MDAHKKKNLPHLSVGNLCMNLPNTPKTRSLQRKIFVLDIALREITNSKAQAPKRRSHHSVMSQHQF